ncbi:hypothetical protein NML43_26970 [Rhodopseudomonas palustris]|uniref:hypothetical protein n=1 Tax=Rhodopseudomonas palustris TaxID=1076 RepID=UPI0020CD9322|nr:hypothetical protein [Rhodopseudomonas palustris]MCP9630749.1 hypothetical protein [Rhodopseudomonas palustris]
MQPIESEVTTVGELIKYPQDAVHFEPQGSGQLAKPSVAGQKSPKAGFRDSKCERVRRGKMSALPTDRRRACQFSGRQFLDPQAQRSEAIAKVPGKLSCKEQVGDCKLKRETKQVLQQGASL